ncbi:hypothetical protein [Streptomyces mirabilis]|uniref:hypothetical protein n=1 Tax=Streptomyces mirabilis TaxID=68239 RepID=UPI0022C5D5AC|nr:hypothetical protein [Streptomyces mirabilis]
MQQSSPALWAEAVASALNRAEATPNAVAQETTESGGWSIDWEGQCEGISLWFTVYGHPTASTAEVRINEWIFAPVSLGQAEEFLFKALSGDAVLQRGVAGLGSWRLKITVGSQVIVNTDREGSGKPETEWELRLLQQGP